MNNLINWLENSFAPKMNKFNHNTWVVTIKDSIMQVLPFILLGSLFCVGTVIEGFVTLPFSFWTPYGWTMGMISVLVSFLIPFNFCEKKRLRKQRIIAGATGLILFFISITPELVKAGEPGFGSSAFGAGGMFCAMFTGIVTSIVFNLFGKFSFFKEDSAIPDFVRQWFDALLPIGGIIFTGFIVVQVLNIDLYAIITSFFMPLQGIMNTWYGFILVCFLECFIYSMGISSWVLAPATSPVKLQSIAANIALATAGTASVANLNMYTESCVYTCYLWIGGIACTMPLVIFLALSKSKKLKSLGRACIGPTIFNINEPVLFGLPIVFNPIMFVPFCFTTTVIYIVAYAATALGLVSRLVVYTTWSTPIFLSGYMASGGDFRNVILQVICLGIAVLIYLPFVKLLDRQQITAVEEEEFTEDDLTL